MLILVKNNSSIFIFEAYLLPVKSLLKSLDLGDRSEREKIVMYEQINQILNSQENQSLYN